MVFAEVIDAVSVLSDQPFFQTFTIFTMAQLKTRLALRVNEDNPNHHLWNNRGVWWCHLTVHKSDATSERLRFSLKTHDVESARDRRDRILRGIAEHYEIAA